MKKFFAIAFIAAALVACNNDSETKTEEKKDSTVIETPGVDTLKTDTLVIVPDTTKK